MAHVTAQSSRLIFCEGDESSLDSVLLHQLVPVGKAEIKVAGGKYGMRAFIEGHLVSYGDSQPDYLGFRDRDFDVEPPGTSGLIRLTGAKPIWMTYRASVESYFIDAQLLYRYWTESSMGPSWQYGPPPTTESIEVSLLQAAHDLAEYQAIRWALAKLKPGARWPEVNTTWTEGSGHLPASLAFDVCLGEARRLVGTFVSEINGVSTENLDEEARRFHERFSQDDFYTQRLFLIWYHGKDLLVQWSRRLTPGFPYRHYASWAAQHMDCSQHPDLQQLAGMCA